MEFNTEIAFYELMNCMLGIFQRIFYQFCYINVNKNFNLLLSKILRIMQYIEIKDNIHFKMASMMLWE